jgi:hypothetical protein
MTVRLSRYDRQVGLAIKTVLNKHFKKRLGRLLRKHVGLYLNDPANQAGLSQCMTELVQTGAFPRNGKPSHASRITADSVRHWISCLTRHPVWLPERVGHDVASELATQALMLDAQFRMPPIRREPAAQTVAKPLTVVQRRGRKAAARLRTWQRRAAMAKNKVATYRKKVAYYKKKGAI